MSNYVNNHDGTLTRVATNTELLGGSDAKYVTQADLTAGLATKQNLLQYSTMPTASADTNGKLVVYTGTTTSNYIQGHTYICVESSGTYSWVDITAPKLSVNASYVIDETQTSYTEYVDYLMQFTYTNTSHFVEVIQIYVNFDWYAEDADTNTPYVDVVNRVDHDDYNKHFVVYRGQYFSSATGHIGAANAYHECHGSTIVLPKNGQLFMAVSADWTLPNNPKVKYIFRATKILEID